MVEHVVVTELILTVKLGISETEIHIDVFFNT